MKNKSLRAKYLYRFVLPGALCAAISCTASIPAFADEIIVEDAALVTEADASDAVDVVVEDDDVIEIDTEAEDASAQERNHRDRGFLRARRYRRDCGYTGNADPRRAYMIRPS